jgi:hypothetical protein
MDLEHDDHATGVILLLSIRWRVRTRLECGVRRRLAMTKMTREELSAGNPTRPTVHPTAERLLEAFHRLTLTIRGGLDLSECSIDGTCVVAQKGGAGWERPSEAKARRSWQWQTALVFLSPSTLPVLRRMKSALLKPLSPLSPMCDDAHGFLECAQP